ncbi:MAG: FAD-linked oxidase C-terminal domain-containing protein [Bacteroidota bacterium]
MPRLRPDHIRELRALLGDEAVLTDPEAVSPYARDETEDLSFMPEAVLRPSSTGEVSRILSWADSRRVPVTPRGGGTGLSGGALAVEGGICLSMERFNRILELDAANHQALVEPGVITQKFQEEAEAIGLFYPPDPASRGSCTIGGNLAECAGGPRAVKYGVTKDYVLGLEAVLPSGRIIRTGGRTLKNVSGYNLTQILIGSEGTLAVITAVRLRLIPLPAHRKVVLVAFPSLDAAAQAVAAVFQAGITPSACEFMERAAVQAAEERLGKKFPRGGAAAQLLIEVDGNNEAALDEEIARVASVVEGFGAEDVLLAAERQKVEDVWALRRSIGEAVKSISAYREEDTVVPRARLPELVGGVKEICARRGITSICYGHAGDGNVHVNILRGDLEESSWREKLEAAVEEIFRLTVSLGGTISGEHGIGYTQKPYLPLALGEEELRLMRGLKLLFDPRLILNPGKIFL